MDKFKVGELVELFQVEFPEFSGNIGRVLEVTGASRQSLTLGRYGEEMCFITPVKDASGWYELLSRNIRRIEPPSQSDFTAGEWELCPWQPNKLKAGA